MNKNLVEVVNSKGYVIKTIQDGEENKFGKTNIVTIEGGQYRITFLTNVLHGVNYSNIQQVTDYLNGRTYVSPRFHMKFIPLIGSINGDTYIRENNIATPLLSKHI